MNLKHLRLKYLLSRLTTRSLLYNIRLDIFQCAFLLIDGFVKRLISLWNILDNLQSVLASIQPLILPLITTARFFLPNPFSWILDRNNCAYATLSHVYIVYHMCVLDREYSYLLALFSLWYHATFQLLGASQICVWRASCKFNTGMVE